MNPWDTDTLKQWLLKFRICDPSYLFTYLHTTVLEMLLHLKIVKEFYFVILILFLKSFDFTYFEITYISFILFVITLWKESYVILNNSVQTKINVISTYCVLELWVSQCMLWNTIFNPILAGRGHWMAPPDKNGFCSS